MAPPRISPWRRHLDQRRSQRWCHLNDISLISPLCITRARSSGTRPTSPITWTSAAGRQGASRFRPGDLPGGHHPAGGEACQEGGDRQRHSQAGCRQRQGKKESAGATSGPRWPRTSWPSGGSVDLLDRFGVDEVEATLARLFDYTEEER